MRLASSAPAECQSPALPLALLVLGVRADDAHDSPAPDHFALVTNRLHAHAHLHTLASNARLAALSPRPTGCGSGSCPVSRFHRDDAFSNNLRSATSCPGRLPPGSRAMYLPSGRQPP